LEWMNSQGIKKVSQALTTILEGYLGVGQNRPIVEGSENDRLRIVEQNLESLFQEVRSLTERIEKNSGRVVQTELFPVAPLEETLPDNKEATVIDSRQGNLLEESQNKEPEPVLDNLLEPKTQDSTQETDEEIITTDESKKSSLTLENQQFEGFKPIMSDTEVGKLLNKSRSTIKSRRIQNKEFQEKGYRFSPAKEEEKPRWKVEEVEKDEF
jgi:hypothetical protein